MSFNEARTTLEKMLTGEFEDRCINYMSPAFSYNKASLVNASNEISMVEESFMVILSLLLLADLSRMSLQQNLQVD